MPFSARSIGALAALSLTSAVASAAGTLDESAFQYETAKDLVAVCSSDQDAARLACRAFLEATVQYHDAVTDGKKVKRLICYPRGTTVEETHRLFLAWAKQNAGDTERMGELPVKAVVRALASAYPCP
jgi:hypothetical protein